MSLQYVPFAYQEKGLPFQLPVQLLHISGKRRWHVMFHELWVGINKEASIKHLMWGWLQKKLIASLLKDLHPEVIHTQTHLYQYKLQQLGIQAKYLNLFSNISLVTDASNFEPGKQKNVEIKMIIFGLIHPGAPVEEFIQEVNDYAKKSNQNISLIIIGRNGSEHKKWISLWESFGMTVTVFGEQTEKRISEALQQASFGISTTPYAQIEKSGTVAAMLTHRLPVLCVAESWQPRGIKGLPQPPGICQYIPGNLQELLTKKIEVPSFPSVAEVTQQYHS